MKNHNEAYEIPSNAEAFLASRARAQETRETFRARNRADQPSDLQLAAHLLATLAQKED